MNKFYLQNGDKIQIPSTMKFIINGENDYYDFQSDIKTACLLIDG